MYIHLFSKHPWFTGFLNQRPHPHHSFPKSPQVHQTLQPFVWTSWAQKRRQRTLEGECTKGLFHGETQLNLAGAAGALHWCENWEPHKVSLAFSPCQLDFIAGVCLLHMCGVRQPEGSYQRLWIKGYPAVNTKPAGFREPHSGQMEACMKQNLKGIGCGGELIIKSSHYILSPDSDPLHVIFRAVASSKTVILSLINL